jgi:hypothetical protein
VRGVDHLVVLVRCPTGELEQLPRAVEQVCRELAALLSLEGDGGSDGHGVFRSVDGHAQPMGDACVVRAAGLDIAKMSSQDRAASVVRGQRVEPAADLVEGQLE